MNWIELRDKILKDMPCTCMSEKDIKLWTDGVDTAISFIKDELTNQQLKTIVKGTDEEITGLFKHPLDTIGNQRI